MLGAIAAKTSTLGLATGVTCPTVRYHPAIIADLPEPLPVIAVAAGGRASAAMAAELGGGLFATEPKSSIVDHYREAGGPGPRYAEVPIAWATDEEQAVRAARETSRWAITGWKVMSELPNPVNFDAATSWLEDHHVRQQFSVGPDPEVHVARARVYVEAGYDHIVVQNAGPDPDGFLDFFAGDLNARLRALA
ncbi:LLM class flavin-dependent oxidoreductase [Micromonospora kangleipakensis]|uniref:LLM class flavin-dependent oxidoreductase n=1 Tax=Micromonospora kangleipakensis TaxID=1077942 RepID=UPI001F5E9A97|nr:LLM class flavin-dependent oxidoreductase [Micromonospora kangleipakensis]